MGVTSNRIAAFAGVIATVGIQTRLRVFEIKIAFRIRELAKYTPSRDDRHSPKLWSINHEKHLRTSLFSFHAAAACGKEE